MEVRIFPALLELRSGRTLPPMTSSSGGPGGEGGPGASGRVCQLRQRDPPSFSGATDDDVSDWLTQYNRVSSHNAWDETTKLANVVFFLKGTALQWFENHEATFTSWPVFCELITKLFGRPSQRKHYALQRLSTRAQTPGETCTCYVEDVLFLCRRVDTSMSEQDKVNHVMKGIADDIFNYLAPKSPTTVSELVEECGKFEEMRNRRVPCGFQRLPQTLATSVPCDTQSLLELVRRVVADEIRSFMIPPAANTATTHQVKSTVPVPVPCVNEVPLCTIPPHVPPPQPTYAEVCASQPWHSSAPHTPYRPFHTQPPEDPHRAYGRPTRTNLWRTPDGRPICYYCHSVGHILRYCRRRPGFSPPFASFHADQPRRQDVPDTDFDREDLGVRRRPRTSSPYPRRRRSLSPMVPPTPN